ncbi:hypothetical protein PVAND_010011 [Polypedilum vanderplanki]|uniref:AMP-dependent synthetase/ligase domain-containing protein n=1 Tax=Polypedilum vanderplanki TaxID=319348 RepID=A0A9J6CFC2_POLVA|nr:hypothetical protein PVAND_010011 [Polypedilum vanderplanki]
MDLNSFAESLKAPKKIKIKDIFLNGIRRNYNQILLHEKFEKIVEAFPDAKAIISEEGNDTYTMTYKELSLASDKLYQVIFELLKENEYFTKNESPFIAIIMRPSYQMIITILAIWKAGCGYLPLDFNDRSSYIKSILNESKPEMIFIEDFRFNDPNLEDFRVYNINELLEKSKDTISVPINEEKPENSKYKTALVLYSTTYLRQPKGTKISHDNCMQRIEWQWEFYPYSKNEKSCIVHNSNFHIDCFAETWAPLLSGKCLIIMNESNRNDPLKLIEKMEEFKIMRFYGRPMKVQKILEVAKEKKKENSKQLENVKLWISSGEKMPKSLAIEFFNYYNNDGCHTIANFYGCTETTGDCCTFSMSSLEQIQDIDEIPLGLPNPNTYIYILDENLDQVKLGEIGEIYVSGAFLAKCEIISEANRFESKTFYRNSFNLHPTFWTMFQTGDLGYIKNGLLYFESRKDRKCRAGDDYTIDLDELDKKLNDIDYVENAYVTYKDFKILAFIQLKRSYSGKSEKEIQFDLKNILPEYGVPKVNLVFKMPIVDDNKIDIKQLLLEYENHEKEIKRKTLHVNFNFDDVEPDRIEFVKEIFRIIGIRIGFDVKDVISLKSNFFQIGGSKSNIVSCVGDLRTEGFYINLEDFLEAKNFDEIIKKIIKNERMSLFSAKVLTIERNTEWRIQLAYNEDAVEAAELIANYYITKKPLFKFFPNLRKESIIKFVVGNWYYFVEKRLSFKIVGLSNKIIGMCLNIEIQDQKLLEMKDLKEVKPLMDYLVFLSQKFDFKPYKFQKVLMPYMIAADVSLSQKDEIRVIYHLEEYLVEFMRSCEYRLIFAESTSPLTIQLRKICFDYRTFKEFPVNRYIDSQGNRIFQSADVNLKTFIQIYENK